MRPPLGQAIATALRRWHVTIIVEWLCQFVQSRPKMYRYLMPKLYTRWKKQVLLYHSQCEIYQVDQKISHISHKIINVLAKSPALGVWHVLNCLVSQASFFCQLWRARYGYSLTDRGMVKILGEKSHTKKTDVSGIKVCFAASLPRQSVRSFWFTKVISSPSVCWWLCNWLCEITRGRFQKDQYHSQQIREWGAGGKWEPAE